MTADKQRFQIKSFLFVGFPIGYSVIEIIKLIIFGLSKYHFSIPNCIFTFVFDSFLISPLIINYFLHKIKYKQLINKIKDRSEFNVRSLFDFNDFKKGQSYVCYFTEIINKKGITTPTYYVCKNSQTATLKLGLFYYEIELKDAINKFELDDIKQDRLKKLNKLNKQPWYKIDK